MKKILLLLLVVPVAQGAEERWVYADTSIVIYAFDTINDNSPEKSQDLLRRYAAGRYYKTHSKIPDPRQLQEQVFLPLAFELLEATPKASLQVKLLRGDQVWSGKRWPAQDEEQQYAPWVGGERGDLVRRLVLFDFPELEPSDLIVVSLGRIDYVLKQVR